MTTIEIAKVIQRGTKVKWFDCVTAANEISTRLTLERDAKVSKVK
ncbi:unnamed protein product [marine sediment metagenome]|uniref:Uncharacterized protein n=1 Tax=marine sediment metagenome TaxID=412755 RepID=X0SWG9_9ZZZZ